MKRLILLAVLAAALAPGALAASLRGMTTLHGPVVILRDLFDDAGPNADRVLGPGPVPGDRIVVEAAQLNAIARQFNVQWRSVSAADRAVLEWPGRPLRLEEAIEAVKAAVTGAGASEDIDIDIPGFAPPMVPVDTEVSVAVSQLDFDHGTGRFTAALTVTGEAMNAITMRISGRVETMAAAVVAVTRLVPETMLRPDDVRAVRMRASRVPDQAVISADQVAGMQLRRPVAAGQPLRLADLMRPPLVQHGSIVQVELRDGGLAVTAQATALDDGAEGERIRVQNVNSRVFAYADVIGPDRVRIVIGTATPNALPIRADRRVRTP